MDHFVDLAAIPYMDAARKIRRPDPHLFDLQCHTRGSRPEIAAVRPAPISAICLFFLARMGELVGLPYCRQIRGTP